MKFFYNLKIKYKLIIIYFAIFIISLGIINFFVYSNYSSSLKESIEVQLDSSTDHMVDMIKIAADVSIKNHLRTIADTQLNSVNYYYNLYKSGDITETEAKNRAEELLLSQKIGSTGYIYVLNSNTKLMVHPELKGSTLSNYDFAKSQIDMKTGYIEYDWKNPTDSEMRPKALYMTYFEPWDWIISASSYRSEFNDLIDISDFRESVIQKKFGKTGYSAVIGPDGTFLIHPQLENQNMLLTGSTQEMNVIKTLYNQKTGKHSYMWKNPNEEYLREKIAIFDYIPEYEWIVFSTGYTSEFYDSLYDVQRLILITTFISLILIFLIINRASQFITKPLELLAIKMHEGSKGNLNANFIYDSNDEIGDLTNYYNLFLNSMNEQQLSLKSEIKQKELAEYNILKSKERLTTILNSMNESFLEIDLDGNIKDFNPELINLLDYGHDELMNMTIFDFLSPVESAILTNKLSDRKLGLNDHYELPLLSKFGDVVYTWINATPLYNDANEVYGSFGIITDISNLKELTNNLENLVIERTQELQNSFDLLKESQSKAVKAELLASLNDLVSGVAHNINTPLGVSISSVSHLEYLGSKLTNSIKENKLSKSQLIKFLNDFNNNISLIQHNLDRTNQLIKSFKLLSGSQSIGEKKNFSLSNFINENASKNFNHPLVEKPIPISLNLDDVVLNSYPLAFSIILENLYSNTLEHNSSTSEVKVSLSKNNSNIYLEYCELGSNVILDDGMFKPFYTTKPDKHVGLGLTIINNIVTKTFQGSIHYDRHNDSTSNLLIKFKANS